jgi:hypothetical protein
VHKQKLSRRSVLKRSVELPLGLLLVSAGMSTLAAAEVGGICADPSKMDAGQKSTRESLHYTEGSPDAAKTCSECGFFQPTADGCGTCMIFSGPANSRGHCDSWAPKG